MNLNNLKNINDNPISKRVKDIYSKQSDEVKNKLDNLRALNYKEYQLKVIKCSKSIPKIGDVFEIKPNEETKLYGIVVNAPVKNRNGDDLILIFVMKTNISIYDFKFTNDELLISPMIVGREYWSKGYFFNTGEMINVPSDIDYGFYDIVAQKYVDEYGNDMKRIPQILGVMSVSTISGVAYEINKALIISNAQQE